MRLYFSDEEQVRENILESMEAAADLCLLKEGLDPALCVASVSFVEAEEIQEINRNFRGIDQVTDVLSFPQYEDASEIQDELSESDEDAPLLEIGDVVICNQRAEEQAAEFGHSIEREILYLFVHSILHLLGYDHMEPEEKAVMREREEEVMEEIGVSRA